MPAALPSTVIDPAEESMTALMPLGTSSTETSLSVSELGSVSLAIGKSVADAPSRTTRWSALAIGGSLPPSLTVTLIEPSPVSRPSDTLIKTASLPGACPASMISMLPFSWEFVVMPVGGVAPAKKKGSPSGSTQFDRPLTVARPPWPTDTEGTIFWTGASLTSSPWTVSVTRPCAVPPRPSETS